MPSMKFAATSVLLACLIPFTHGQEDSTWEPGDYGQETCQLQQDILSFTVDRVDSRCGGCGTYKVCMTLHGLERGAIMKTCVKDSEVCNPPPFSAYFGREWSSTSPTGVAKGYDWKDPFDAPTVDGAVQCQYVSAGATADFSVVDGYRCLPTNTTRWPDEAHISGVTADDSQGVPQPVGVVCHSRPTWIELLGQDPFGSCCACTLPKSECVWRVTVPACSPSPSPSPECYCPPENPDCRAEIDGYAQQGEHVEVNLNNCFDAQSAADKINQESPTGTYGCEASKVPNCNTIHCDTFVPASAYSDFNTCPVPSPSP